MLRIEPGIQIHTPRTRAARDGAVNGLHALLMILRDAALGGQCA